MMVFCAGEIAASRGSPRLGDRPARRRLQHAFARQLRVELPMLAAPLRVAHLAALLPRAEVLAAPVGDLRRRHGAALLPRQAREVRQALLSAQPVELAVGQVAAAAGCAWLHAPRMLSALLALLLRVRQELFVRLVAPLVAPLVADVAFFVPLASEEVLYFVFILEADVAILIFSLTASSSS